MGKYRFKKNIYKLSLKGLYKMPAQIFMIKYKNLALFILLQKLIVG